MRSDYGAAVVVVGGLFGMPLTWGLLVELGSQQRAVVGEATTSGSAWQKTTREVVLRKGRLKCFCEITHSFYHLAKRNSSDLNI